MNTKKKRNRIILCLCSILVLVASIFAVIPFNKETQVVKADTFVDTYSFTGSPLYTKINTLVNDELSNSQYDISLLYKFSTDSLGYINTIGFSFTFYNGGIHSRNYNISNTLGYFDYLLTLDGVNHTYRFFYQFSSSRLMGKPIRFELHCDNDAYGVFTYSVTYFDADNNFLLLHHLFKGATPGYYDLPVRTYYFEDAFNLTDNQYYKQGYDAGKLDGLEQGETSGYTDGFEAGKNEGYWDGYEQAIENDDRYNFTNLIASVIDVPVKTFTSLFNFEILGVNLSGFFLGLLTCCIVIGVIRLIL